MSLTVEKCMGLPAFHRAEVVAGHQGMNQTVHSITVLEYADAAVISPEFFLNHEIVLTAFAFIKEDFIKQCAIIRRMKEVGICALVLYYVGIFVPRLDQTLIDTANEVGLPLICMPEKCFDLRYGEAINDVLYAVYRDQEAEMNFIPEMLESVAQLPERQRTLPNLMQILSDRFHCSFYLADQSDNLIAEGLWPRYVRWDYQKLLLQFSRSAESMYIKQPATVMLDQLAVSVSCSIVIPKRISPLNLLVIDEQHSITTEQISLVAELIATYLNISNYEMETTTPEMIIRYIITNEQLRVRELAKKHAIDLKKIENVWILHGKHSSENRTQNRMLGERVNIVRNFFRKNGKRVLADIYSSCIVILFENAAFSELDEHLETELLNELNTAEIQVNLIKCMNILTMQSMQSAYALIISYFDTVQLLYPERSIFYMHDLRYAEKISNILNEGSDSLNSYLQTLLPLQRDPNAELLLNTLSVYLLDADKNIQRAAELLGVHKNTVRYRLNLIKTCFACEISEMPLASEIYDGLSVHRLMKKR